MKTHFNPHIKKHYPWTFSDPDIQAMLYVFIQRENFNSWQNIWKRVKRSVEHGMYQRVIYRAKVFKTAEKFFITDEEKTDTNERLQRKLQEKWTVVCFSWSILYSLSFVSAFFSSVIKIFSAMSNSSAVLIILWYIPCSSYLLTPPYFL